MAVNTRWSVAARNAAADATATLLNTGYIRLYDSTGGGQPADPSVAVGTNVLLAELRFGNPAFGAAAAGVATANAITDDADADNTGTATWYRALKSDGTTAVMDGSVGTAATNIVLATASIVQHAIVRLTAFTITYPMQGA